MDDSLEALLEKATNPKNRYEDWEFIMEFCDKINTEVEGPQIALRIIVPKIRDTNEKVAMLALALLEACVKNCGRTFHQELGKFRFLNELIRMISPKYLGTETTEPVKDKIKELLYSWKVGLPNEPKITEAFEMLKRQGLVFDESVPPGPTLEEAPSKPKVQLQQDPRHSQMLAKLLKSKNPEDLRAANRLIRDMVRRDDKRMDKLKKRLDDLELINNNIKLLSEMLSHYKPDSAEHEKIIIEELHSSVEKMRPQLFKMASELQQNEEGMTDILQTNESLLRVMDYYKRVMGGGSTGHGQGEGPGNQASNEDQPPAPEKKPDSPPGADLLLDLADLNFDTPTLPVSNGTSMIPSGGVGMATGLLNDLNLLDVPTTLGSMPPLNFGGADLLSSHPSSSMPFTMLPPVPVSTGQTSTNQSTFPDVDLLGGLTPVPPPTKQEPPTLDPFTVLNDLTVPIESLKPTSDPPIQLVNKHGITGSLYFVEANPAPSITGMVVTLSNTNPRPINNVLFQAAVPKVMKVKLLPPTRTELPGFNPLIPMNMSQVLLLANPSKAEVRLKFRISFIPQGEQEVVEVGEVSKIPFS